MERLLTALTTRGPTVLSLGVIVGLAWPWAAELARPTMAGAIFVLLLATLLRVETAQVTEAVRRPLPLLALAAVAIIACPLLALPLASATGLPADLSLALVLALAAPPSTGTAALAWMLGLDGTMALIVTLVATALVPLSLGLLAPLMPGLAIDPLMLAMKLTALIGGAAGLAVLLRRHASAALVRHRPAVDALALISLLLFALSAMAGVQARIVAEPLTALASVALAFAVNLGQLALCALLPVSFTRRWTAGLVLGNRNVGLVWSALGTAVTPAMALYFAATQLPIYTLPRVLQAVLPRLRARGRRSETSRPGHPRCHTP